MKRAAHIILSSLLAFLLLFGGTSKELIHLFAAHTDTNCVAVHHDGPVIEKQHHHCDFLNYSLTAFDNDLQLPFVAVNDIGYHIACLGFYADFVAGDIGVFRLRGPPAA